MSLKEEILRLKSTGMIQSEIAKTLSCSSGTVSYHCNESVKDKIITRKRQIRKVSVIPQSTLDKELKVNVNNKVDWRFAEAICNSRLIELGYETFFPFNGGGEIDMLAIKDGLIKRIQVKSITPTSKNKIELNLTRNSINYKTIKRTPYTQIDWFLIFDGTNIYKIDSSETDSYLTLRYRVPSNNQLTGVKMASDYLL